MAEPRPVLRTIQGALLAAGVLAFWWASLPAPERQARLLQIALVEGVSSLPPDNLFQHPEWLSSHRLTQLTSLVGVLVLVALIGLAQGQEHRAEDVLGGYRLKVWTCGIVGLGSLAGLLGLYLVVPYPLPLRGVAGVLGLLVALVSYALGAGRPQVH